MGSLSDIGPLVKQADIRGTKVDVSGVTPIGIVGLINEFPEVKHMLAGITVEITPERVMELGPEVIAAFIAAGCGQPGDVAARKIALGLTIGEQFDLIEKIIETTFPNGGVRPFVERVRALVKDAGVDVPGWGQDTRSEEPSTS
jgi:hypothetical protein